ncbi:hypothetical protein GCM10009812_22890 [Nocardioides marinus]
MQAETAGRPTRLGRDPVKLDADDDCHLVEQPPDVAPAVLAVRRSGVLGGLAQHRASAAHLEAVPSDTDAATTLV